MTSLDRDTAHAAHAAHAAEARHERTAFAASVALAVAITVLFLRRGHHGDTAVFRDWSLAREASHALYRTARADVNYPIVGALLAVAPGALVRALTTQMPSAEAYHALTKLLLLPVNIALLLTARAALFALRVERPSRHTLLLYALPSSWVLASYFAQLDGVVFALELASAAFGARALARAHANARAALVARPTVASLLCAHAALLTKQLALFALPGLLALPVATALLLARARRWRDAAALIGVTLASPLLLVAFDPLIALPPGYRTHLGYVFMGAGPAHGDELGNGPSLWTFLSAAADDSSHAPFAPGLSPYRVGRALVVLVGAALTARLIAHLRAPMHDAARTAARIVAYAGLVHLTVALFVPGTHERYAGAAVPLLFVALAKLAPAQRASLALYAVFYGLFVLSTLEYDRFAYVFPLRAPSVAACALFALFALGLRAFAARGDDDEGRASRANEAPLGVPSRAP